MRTMHAARVAIVCGVICCTLAPSRSECAELKRPPALPGEQAAVDFVLDLKGSGGVDESGHIEWIDLTINQATDEHLAAIRGLKHLKRLELASNSIGDAGLEIIASCPNLTELDLQGTKITDAGLAKLAVLKRLEKLDLSHTDIGDEGFLALGELPELRTLDLASTKVGDAGLALLGRSPKLRSLELRRLNTKPDDSEKVTLCEAALAGRPGLITDQGLKHLASCAALEYLGLSGARVTDEGLRQLVGLKNLAKLDLSSTPIDGRGLAHLQTLAQLRDLYLNFTEFGPSGAAAVGKLKQLTCLSLDETPTTDAMLIPLAELTALRELFLRATKISNAGIVRLGPMFRLHEIEADGTAVDDSGNRLLATILPRCRMSYDARPQTEEQQAAEVEQNGLFFKLFSGDQEAFRTGAAKYPTLVNRVYPIMFASVQMPFANFSPLSYAAHEDDLKIARFLIELGARPGVSVQNPLLHVRSTEMAELMIKYGAVIEPADEDDDSPLLHAQNAKLADLFLRHGAEINRFSKHGRTPLHEAVELERFDVVRLLVERGADIDSKPLPRTRLGYLHEGARYHSPLECALFTGKCEIALYLHEHGAKVGLDPEGGTMAMYHAVAANDPKMFRFLVERGVDPRRDSRDDESHLHGAVRHGSTGAMITYVLAAGVPIETTTPVGAPPKFDPFRGIPIDPRGWTALHLAAHLGKVATVRTLLERGADVHAKTTAGWTPLECVDVMDENSARSCDADDDKTHRREIRELLRAKMAQR